jgi:hypothetical protein
VHDIEFRIFAALDAQQIIGKRPDVAFPGVDDFTDEGESFEFGKTLTVSASGQSRAILSLPLRLANSPFDKLPAGQMSSAATGGAAMARKTNSARLKINETARQTISARRSDVSCWFACC